MKSNDVRGLLIQSTVVGRIPKGIWVAQAIADEGLFAFKKLHSHHQQTNLGFIFTIKLRTMSDNNVKVKKAVYKRWWFWLIAIFIILIVIGSSGGKDKSASSTNSDSGNSKSAAQTETKYGLKQPVSVGDLVYTANSVKKQTTVGSGAFAKTSQSGTYVVTNLTVKNNGNETVTIDSSLFELTDVAGRTFKPSSEGQTAMMFNGKDNFFLKQVQPGLSATGDIVFEIPVDATGLKISVSAGLFSSKKATIDLE